MFLFFPNVVTKSRLFSDIAVPVDCAAGFFVSFFGDLIMTLVMNANTRSWVKAFLMCALLFGAQMAMAAGGLGSIESGMKSWFTSFYGIVAIIAGFALLGCAAMGMLNMKSWGDLIPVMGWIVVAAASSALVKALWDWGKSASF